MKKIIISSLFVSLVVFFMQAQKYSYKFKIEGVENDTIYLASYYAGKLYFNDTAYTDEKGNGYFKGEKEKPKGMYAIVLPDKKTFFDIVISKPSFYFETKKNNLEESLVFKKSEENKVFYKYKLYLIEKNKEAEKLRNSIDSTNKEKNIEIENNMKKVNNDVIFFRKDFLKKNTGLFITKVMKMTIEPIPPKDYDKKDKSFPFRYFKDHFFDNVDMKDDALLRTPILNDKISTYISKLTVQIPDSICSAAEYLTSLTNEKSEIYKYIVTYISTTYEKSKLMGMDAVFVCMVEKYYSQNKAYWIDSAKTKEIVNRYKAVKELILGKKAGNIILPDTAGTWHSLYDIDSKYTILYFWSPTCGHCKKEMPKVQEFYEKNKGKDFEIYGVCNELEEKKYIEFLRKHKIKFLNVSDTPEINKNAWDYINSGKTTLNSLNFRDQWDLFSTPQLYILDKNKKIIGKRIAIEQIEGFIKSYENKNK